MPISRKIEVAKKVEHRVESRIHNRLEGASDARTKERLCASSQHWLEASEHHEDLLRVSDSQNGRVHRRSRGYLDLQYRDTNSGQCQIFIISKNCDKTKFDPPRSVRVQANAIWNEERTGDVPTDSRHNPADSQVVVNPGVVRRSYCVLFVLRGAQITLTDSIGTT